MATSAKTRKATPAGRRSTRSKSSVAKTAKASVSKTVKAETKEDLEAPVTKGSAAAKKATGADASEAGDHSQRFKRRDLLEAVAARSAMKRSDLRVTVELVLDELGKALDRGEELVLQPLGKMVVKRRNPAKNGDVYITRIKRSGAVSGGLAEDGGDG